PWTPLGSPMGFNNLDANGNPTAPIVNELVNFGWEYVFHCHILSHEEMDMMRPVSVAMPPNVPDGLVFDAGVLTWNDNSINETAFLVQRSADGGANWVDLKTIDQPLHQTDLTVDKGQRSYMDTTFDPNLPYLYRVVALNRIGYLDGAGGFSEMTVQSVSDPLDYTPPLVAVPILTAAYQAGPQILLNWSNVVSETGYVVDKSTDGVIFVQIASLGADVTTYTDATVAPDSVYYYRVTATSLTGDATSNIATVTTPPTAPIILGAVYQDKMQAVVTWADTSTYEDGFVVVRIDGDITTEVATVPADTTTYTDTALAFDGQYVYQVYAFNASGPSALSDVSPEVHALPFAPTGLTAVYDSGVQLTWFDNSEVETGFSVQRCDIAVCTDTDFTEIATPGPFATGTGVGNVTYIDTNVTPSAVYTYRVAAVNAGDWLSDFSSNLTITLPNFPEAPIPGNIARAGTRGRDARRITVTWTGVPDVNGYTIQWATDSTFATLVGSGSANQDATSFTTRNLTRGNTYYFRIRANSNANGSSLWADYPDYTLP
ncbi:MAG: hypothetical protein WA996_23825, partial [Candidatus Promineifilaceae bacterium]